MKFRSKVLQYFQSTTLKSFLISRYFCTYKFKSRNVTDFQMIAVHPDARGLGLATDLVKRSVQLATCLGFVGCKTEATGNYSKKAFLKCGFEIVSDIKYKEFKVDGKKPFAAIKEHEGVAFLAKQL